MTRNSERPTPDDFVTLLTACDARMRALAYSMLGSTELMDDVLQDAYLSAYRAYGGFRGESSFATWLGSIVYRKCLDHGRSLARRRITPVENLDHWADQRSPEEAVDAHLEVMAALGQLSADHRAVLVLVDLEGLSLSEAAEVLAVPPGTAASRLSRARLAFHKVLAGSLSRGLSKVEER
ncbi:MAG: sigma-70 family RNA polymerase sigma factor [Acidimicrobiia bacterium]|nr:sigma-70 family RNA polymerase sigma factor [Acidimicrobiia bacterium]